MKYCAVTVDGMGHARLRAFLKLALSARKWLCDGKIVEKGARESVDWSPTWFSTEKSILKERE